MPGGGPPGGKPGLGGGMPGGAAPGGRIWGAAWTWTGEGNEHVMLVWQPSNWTGGGCLHPGVLVMQVRCWASTSVQAYCWPGWHSGVDARLEGAHQTYGCTHVRMYACTHERKQRMHFSACPRRASRCENAARFHLWARHHHAWCRATDSSRRTG